LSDPAALAVTPPADLANRILRLYSAAAGLSLFGIIVLLGYEVRLGPLVGPGVETSFGLAIAVMFLLGALVVHLVDRMYREWPLGRKFHPATPRTIDDAVVASFLKAAVVAAIAGAVVYIFWGLVAS